MNKKVIIPILVILAIGAAVITVKNRGKIKSPTSNGSIEKQSAGSKAKETLQSMLGVGKQVKCTWKQTNEDMDVEGIAYVDNKKAKIEIKMKNNNPSASEQMPDMTISTYTDGEWAYSWGGYSDQGMKFKIDEADQMAPDTNEESNGDTKNEIMKNWNEEFEYDCSSWKVDNSVFQLPSDIEFKDLEQEIKEQMEGAKDMCNSLPSPQKEECLKAF